MAYLSALDLPPTPIQRAAFVALASDDDVVLTAPTGSGKTLAAMLPLLGRLIESPRTAPGVRLVYVAPVRALVSQQGQRIGQIAERLSQGTLRVAVRTGDTPQSERDAYKRHPPDVMIVTPESLAVLLAADTREALHTVREIVLDEVHLLADGKRGALLATTLETLGWLVETNGGPRPRRVGLSATVHPIEAVARWLGGSARSARVVSTDERSDPRVDLIAPPLDAPYPSAAWYGKRMLPAVARAVASSEGTSIVFVASRPRAEQWTQALRDVLPPRMPVACFHGSMAADERSLVSHRLAEGELRAVIATNSLEVGVDVPTAEQVLVVGAPASVTRLLQSAGRSHHRPGARSVARIAPETAPDLVTALAAMRCIARDEIEPLRPREADLDVAVQAVLGLCAAAGPVTLDEMVRVLRRSAPFADIDGATVGEIVDFLATGGDVLAAYDEAQRIALDATGRGYVLAGGRAVRAYRRGIGTIVDEPAVRVRAGGRSIGSLDGQFASMLEPGDRFALAGQTWRVVLRTGTELEVAREPDRVRLVARWAGTRPSLSEPLADESLRLYGELDACVTDDGADAEAAVATKLGIDRGNAHALVELVRAQRSESAMPAPGRFVVEQVRERKRMTLVAHTFAGRMANEVVGRVVAARLRTISGRGAEVFSADLAVAVTYATAEGEAAPDETALRDLFAPTHLERDLASTLEGSHVARGFFREIARIAQLSTGSARPGAASPGLLYDVLRRHAPGHLLLRALGHTSWTALDGDRAARVLRAAARVPHWHIATLRHGPSALAVPLFARSNADRVAPLDLESALVAAAHALWQRHGRGELP